MQVLCLFAIFVSLDNVQPPPFLPGFGVHRFGFPFAACLLKDARSFLLLAVWRFPPVLSRANGFRGYAERSRREKTWDPGSTFYAEGASKHHVSGPRLCNMRRKGGRGSGANGAPSVDTATKRKHQRDRRRVSADTHPVDMDWAKVKSCLTQVQTKLAI